MTEPAAIAYFDRQLVVIPDQWEPQFTEPVEVRRYWPLGIPARPDDERIGIRGTAYTEAFHSSIHGTWPYPDGGKTRCVFVDRRPVKKPRDSKRYTWEWRYGSWVRFPK